MSEKRIIAVFIPEAWIGDNAIEVDGRVQFDVTDKVLAMSEEQRAELQDDDYPSDDLVPDEIRDAHTGPFRVEIEQAIEDYFSNDEERSDGHD